MWPGGMRWQCWWSVKPGCVCWVGVGGEWGWGEGGEQGRGHTMQFWTHSRSFITHHFLGDKKLLKSFMCRRDNSTLFQIKGQLIGHQNWETHVEAVVTVQAGKDEKLTYKSGNQMQEVNQRSPDSGVTAPQVSYFFIALTGHRIPKGCQVQPLTKHLCLNSLVPAGYSERLQH